jgi:2-(1,2-epoxy-1,2-dihydrophenyl)acetyl-CoA isomerase
MTVRLEVSDGLACVAIDRPAVLNALDLETGREWSSAVRSSLEREDIKALMLTGTGSAFCAGGDLEEISGQPSSYIRELAEVIGYGIVALRNSPKPVVAAVNGVVAGGGLGIFLSSDFAVAAEDATFGALYSNVGLTPDLSVTAQLADAIGERRALEMILSPRMLTAQNALEWGLVAEVVPKAEVEGRAREIAASWIQGPSEAFGHSKLLVRGRGARSFGEQLEQEASTIEKMFQSEDSQVLIDRFLSGTATRRPKE